MHYLWIAMVTASLSLSAVASVKQLPQQCAQIAQVSQRLACYDQLSASINSAHTQMNSAPPSSSAVISPAPTASSMTPEEITLTIASISPSVRGKRITSFNNDQVWKQGEARSYRLKAADNVMIKKAALGSYLLPAADCNHSIRG